MRCFPPSHPAPYCCRGCRPRQRPAEKSRPRTERSTSISAVEGSLPPWPLSFLAEVLDYLPGVLHLLQIEDVLYQMTRVGTLRRLLADRVDEETAVPDLVVDCRLTGCDVQHEVAMGNDRAHRAPAPAE